MEKETENNFSYLPKTIEHLRALMFTSYLIGRDDEKHNKRIFGEWFEEIFEKSRQPTLPILTGSDLITKPSKKKFGNKFKLKVK